MLQNPQAAELLISEVQKAIYDRLEMPEAFEKVRSGKQRQYPYYRIYVKNYTILYVVIGNIMEVRHMFYSRRDIQILYDHCVRSCERPDVYFINELHI